MISSSLPIPLKKIESLGAALDTLAVGGSLDHSEETKQISIAFGEKIARSTVHNPWFTDGNIRQALRGLSFMLRPEALNKWMEGQTHAAKDQKKIGMVLAGNIPMVGFHDLFCVAMSGHQAVAKLSSEDKILLPAIFEILYLLTDYEPFKVEWFTDRLPEVDAVIATGSNNTSRYFEYYFSKLPHIIRKNRTSVGILTGGESDEEMLALGDDIFSYFGLGCRNVSKLFVKDDFEIDRFFKGIYPYSEIINHHKYANNFDYYRALWMMNQEDLLENGFMILRPSDAIASPIATVFYERYSDLERVKARLEAEKNEIQCIISLENIPFGNSQKPELWDYADGVDTMEFLQKL